LVYEKIFFFFVITFVLNFLKTDASSFGAFQEAEEKNADLLKFPDQLESLKKAVE